MPASLYYNSLTGDEVSYGNLWFFGNWGYESIVIGITKVLLNRIFDEYVSKVCHMSIKRVSGLRYAGVEQA